VTDTKARILIVDDHRDQLVTLRAMLGDVVEEIVCATSGREALRRLLAPGEFAAMLLDIQMPAMDGFELAEMIRKHRVHRQTPIIFVTASGDDLHVRRSYALGAVDYILAPIVPAVLRAKVTVLVELHKKTEQVRRQAEALRRRATQLHLLTSTSITIHTAASVPEILRTAAEAAKAMVGAMCVVAKAAPAGDRAPPHSVVIRRDESEKDVGPPTSSIDAQLVWSDGLALGTLQVTGKVGGGSFDADDEAVMAQLAHVTSVAVQNRVLGDAREASRLKDEFFTNLSHELRNPLNALVGWIQLLQKLPASEPLKERALQALERNTGLLTRLVDDLLDTSRIAGHALAIVTKPMRLEDAARSTVESLRVTAEAKGIRLECCADDQLEVMGDGQRLMQAVWNLTANALKFTAQGGHVVVRVAREGPYALLIVDDDGEGIAPEFLPHVFERFRQTRTSTPSGHDGGLGLGLSIVRAITELHGGTVRAESKGVGQGARFTLRLPLLASRPLLDASAAQGAVARTSHSLAPEPLDPVF
jgi:signal transduction histidine kinase